MASAVRPAATPLGLEIGDTVATTLGNGKVAGFSNGAVVVQYSFGRGFMSSLSVAKAHQEPKAGHELVELISKRGNKRRAYASVQKMGPGGLASAAAGLPLQGVGEAASLVGAQTQPSMAYVSSLHSANVSQTQHGSYKRGRAAGDD